MKLLKRFFLFSLAAVLLAGGCFASSLDSEMEAFRAEHHLNEHNFACSYYDTVTGETYHYNETAMMVAASTYKLPLNLYYYEMETAGELAPDAYIPNSGTTLAECHRQSIVYSNNEVSIAMLYNLGNFRTYKEKMRKYFTMTDEEISNAYYAGNNYCTRMMLDTLRYLYDHRESFPAMVDYMKQACPGHYFQKYLPEVEIAHKYGSYEGAENDTGIFFTEEPFLLAVYTQGVGENISAEAATLFYRYNQNQWAREQAKALAAAEAAKQEVAAAKVIALQTPAPPPPEEPPAPATPTLVWWMLPVTLGVFLCGGGILWLILRRVRKRHGDEVSAD